MVGAAPAWFVNMTDGTWSTVAGATGSRLRDCLPNPVPHAAGAPDSPGSITAAWTGGAVDQARGEYLFAGNGGHADYPGNEGYAISMRDAQPRWRRVAEPTPNGQLGDVTSEGNGLYADGRPRAMHSTFECYGDGRIWYPLQNSVTSGGGGTYNRVVAFNRDSLGAAATPLPWTAANLGAWELYGNPFPSGTYLGSMIFGVCAFDRVGHKVWALGGNSANYTVYWSVGTSGASVGQVARYQDNKSFGHWGGWVAIAHDLRILVAGDHLRQAVTVLDLDAPGTAAAWTQITSPTGAGHYGEGSGGVYVEANHSIGIGNPKTMGARIYKLQIPTHVVNGQTKYDPAGQWAWTSFVPSGATPTMGAAGNSNAYTKWNIIEDMGNGQSAIVVLPTIDDPVFVYKIPRSGL